MKKKHFEELLESVKQMGEIIRGEKYYCRDCKKEIPRPSNPDKAYQFCGKCGINRLARLATMKIERRRKKPKGKKKGK